MSWKSVPPKTRRGPGAAPDPADACDGKCWAKSVGAGSRGRQYRRELGPFEHLGEEVAELTGPALLDALGNGREPAVARSCRASSRNWVRYHQTLADPVLVLPPGRDRVDLAVRLEEVQRRVQVAPDVLEQFGLVRAARRSSAGSGSSPRRRTSNSARCRSRPGSRRCPRRASRRCGRRTGGPGTGGGSAPARPRPPSGGWACARRRAASAGPAFRITVREDRPVRLGRRLVVGVEQGVDHADVLDRERAVRRRVQVADVVQAVLVLPRRELLDQPEQRRQQDASWWYDDRPQTYPEIESPGLPGDGPDAVGRRSGSCPAPAGSAPGWRWSVR